MPLHKFMLAGMAGLLLGVQAAPAFASSEGGFDFMSPVAPNPATASTVSPATNQAPVSAAALPRTVAILPFDNATAEPGIAEEVRRAFYNQFGSKPYGDIELAAIDAKLLALDRDTKLSSDAKDKTGYQSLCQSLGCDGVITGRVLDFRKIFAGLYSELAVSAEISLINANTGEVVLTRKENVTFREGGFSLSPIGLALSAMSAALNLRDIQRVRLVSELGYTFAKSIPDPLGGSTGSSGPAIQGMLSNASESPFGLGKVITVAIQADGNGSAVFDIGNYRRALPMIEKTPGLYVGEYRIQDGDAVRQSPLVATLRARNGLVSSWYDTSLVNIDSLPPPPPARLSARSQPGKVLLRWDEMTHASDLAGYQVLRSSQPLSGFKPIGVVETPSFVDQDVSDDQYRYYRIVALDQAGNASEPGSIARGRILAENAPPLSGRIEADRELAGNVLVTGELRVPPGVTLQIAPGTRISFAPAATLIIQGGLNSDSRDEPIEFTAQGGGAWGGIRVEGGNIGLRGFNLSGATTGIHLQRAQGILEGGQIQKCDTGLLITGAGAGSASVRDLRISENRIGARLDRSSAELTLNRIASNEVGVDMSSFSGVLRDNAIFQNTLNLRANAGTLLEANYWGSLDPAALRIEGGLVSEALNRPAPDGKVVTLRVSPCAGLAAEACQQKSAEAMVEGGRLFRAKNYGRALTQFEASIAAQPSADAYYFAAICHQEMQEDERAIERLRDGVTAFPSDPSLHRALGMLYLQRGEEKLAREQIGEVLRLSPGDRQAAFMLERLGGAKPSGKTGTQP
ncbi:MAG: tetratricopeptide repeat protein [Pseudomonadota bacterium]|nr:tetratricopeptide repeat protein [Pseudomonadota bacterium]